MRNVATGQQMEYREAVVCMMLVASDALPETPQ